MPFPDVSGLRQHGGIMSFEFKPTIGILARDMDKLGLDIRSFKEPLTRAVKQVMIPSIKTNFDSEGRPGWEPLSEATQMFRAQEGSTGPILNRTGLLKRNMGYQTMWDITQEYAIIKDLPERVGYGRVHQEGVGGMRTRMKGEMAKAARGGKKISADEAGRRAAKAVDHEIISAMKSGKQIKGSQNIPARPFVMFQEQDYDDVEQVFQTWLGERLLRAGWI